MRKIKLGVLFVFIVFCTVTALVTNSQLLTKVSSYAGGPPAGKTAAPGESNCGECHLLDSAGLGRVQGQQDLLNITAPATYSPGATYTIVVTHTAVSSTRLRWGFELTALNENNQAAGTFKNTSGLTQT